MKRHSLQILVLLLIAALVIALALSVLSLLDPIFFWILAGIAAIFAYKVLPKIGRTK
jgi:membrane protein implicated in regulation of membrane protease activity